MPRPRIIDHLDDFAEEIGAQVTAGATNDEILAKLRKDHGLQIGKRTLQSWLSRYSQGSLKRRTPVSKEILETAVSKVIRKKAFKNVGYRKVCAVLDSTGLHADKYRVAMILKKLSPEDVAARMKLPKSPGAAPTPKKKNDDAGSPSPSESLSPSPSPPASPRATKRTKAEVEAPAMPAPAAAAAAAGAAAAAPAPDSAKAMPKSKLPPKKRAKSPSPSASPPPSPKAAPVPAAAATAADTKSPANKRKATSPKKAVKPEELAVSPSKRGGRRNSAGGPKGK